MRVRMMIILMIRFVVGLMDCAIIGHVMTSCSDVVTNDTAVTTKTATRIYYSPHRPYRTTVVAHASAGHVIAAHGRDSGNRFRHSLCVT